VVDQQRSAAIRAGQAAARARGKWIGRPPSSSEIPAEIRARILAEHAESKPLKAIARDLTTDGIPTARGASAWSKNTVRRVVRAASNQPPGGSQ
jgi:DNA invertase Pin-like site-specific DNA recombinase